MNKKLNSNIENGLKIQMDNLAIDILSMYKGHLIHRFNRFVGYIRVDECIEHVLNMYDIVKSRDIVSLSKIKELVYEFVNNELIAYGEITPGNEIKVE